MKIGKFIIRSASGLRRKFVHKLKETVSFNNRDILLRERILQIYSCRILGLCFYRDDNTYEKEEQEILKEVRQK